MRNDDSPFPKSLYFQVNMKTLTFPNFPFEHKDFRLSITRRVYQPVLLEVNPTTRHSLTLL